MQSDARRAAEAPGADMTRPYSLAFKQKMIERLTGKDAMSASQLSRQTGVRQQNLSRWLEEARSLPVVASDTVLRRKWTVEQKARMLAEAANLSGEALCAYLEEEWPATDSDDTTFSLISSAVRSLEGSGNPMSSVVAWDCRSVRCNRTHRPWPRLSFDRPSGSSARS